MQLLCLPFAGAGPSVYRGWAEGLPAQIEVIAVCYPGREERSAETPCESLPQLAGMLADALPDILDRPFAIFGHSMGALLAFELVRLLEAGAGRPEHVFLSAAGAPHLPERRPLHALPMLDFLRELVRLNGIPAELLRDPAMLRYMVPILRADLRACETYRPSAEPRIRCPLSVYGGADDRRMEPRRFAAWGELAEDHRGTGMFEGGHFFWRGQADPLLKSISQELRPVLNGVT